MTKACCRAFFIPLIIYLLYSGFSFYTGNYANFFIICMGISCLGALFFKSRILLMVIIIINALTAMQTAAGFLLLDIDAWIISFVGSLFVYAVVVFAEGKKSAAQKALDSFVSLLHSSPDPIVLLDSLHRVKYISNSFMKMAGLSNPFYAKERPVFDLFNDQKLKDLFYDILTDEDSHTAHEIILDGKQFFFEIVVFELVNEVRGRLVHIIDITSVMQAKVEAEAASRSKSAFLATMSHEIRTPLNAIIGLSEIELQKNLPMDTRTDLEKILGAGTTLLGIINDILDISKIEAGSFELISAEYEIPSQINDTIQLNIVRIGTKNITFKLQVDETLPSKLYGDDLRIKQILNNLLSNAFKYTEQGSVVFSVTWEKRGNEAWVIFTIKDTGTGIKKEDIPRLFSEYSQLNTRANRHIEGTGLGLTIAKSLASLMNGTITVDSDYGKGSVFSIRIPQRIVDETPIGNTTARNLEQFRYKEINRIQRLRLIRNYMPYGKVLIVDDVETNLDVARGLLLPYGLYIDTALSGREAIAKVRAAQAGAHRYDLILMDHMMPEMDGIETVRIIRSEIPGEYGKEVPIIALTANALVGNEQMFLANGFNAFISKPIDLMQLDVALNLWVRSKQSVETLRLAEMELGAVNNDMHETPSVLGNILIDGIDLIKGRDQYNNEAAYLSVLRSWYLHTPALLEKLKVLSRENLSEYAVTVHGIKGSSFGICAHAIGTKAEELEAAAKAQDFTVVKAQNAAFNAMVECTINDLGKLLDTIAAGGEMKLKAPAPDADLLAGLLEAAKRYKPVQMDEILAKLEAFEYESGGELVAWLREQVDNLEYTAICRHLEGREG